MIDEALYPPVEWVEVVVLEPHDEHGIVLGAGGAGVAGQLRRAAHHPVHRVQAV